MLRLASLSILSLLLVGAVVEAGCSGPNCSTNRTQTVTFQSVQTVQTVQSPAVQAGGCQGSVGTVSANTSAGGCSGSQGTSGRQHKLFDGHLLHGNGILHRHKQTASAGYEQTTTIRQWDNRPPATAIVVLPAK